MPEIRTLKGIDTATWSEFKSLAAKSNVKMGILFKSILYEYKKSRDDFWNEILSGEKILNNEEAKAVENEVLKLRKEYGFRI